MTSPCHKCKDRKLGCHAECERYQGYHEERVTISRNKRTERSACEVLYDTDMKIKKKKWSQR